jgi:hypothetical protein
MFLAGTHAGRSVIERWHDGDITPIASGRSVAW